MNEHIYYTLVLGLITLVVTLVATAFVVPSTALFIGLGVALSVLAIDLTIYVAMVARLFFSVRALKASPEYKQAVNLEV